jgi:hypothetical protein
LENRYKIVNPVVSKFISIEKQFFENIARQFKKFDKLDERFTESFNSQPELLITYDPCNYVRGGKLVRSSSKNDDQNQGAKENISKKPNINIPNSDTKLDNNRNSKSINVKNNDLSEERKNIKNAKKEEAPKYRVSEFESLDDFLNVKGNEANLASKKEEAKNILNPDWNVRLSSVEKFENIANNFSATNQFTSDFSNKAKINKSNNQNNSNNKNSNRINSNEIINQGEISAYPSLNEAQNPLNFGYNNTNPNSTANNNLRFSSDLNVNDAVNHSSLGINNNINNPYTNNNLDFGGFKNIQNNFQGTIQNSINLNPNTPSHMGNFPLNNNNYWNQSNNLGSPPVTNDSVQIPNRNPVSSSNNYNLNQQVPSNGYNIYNNQLNNNNENLNFNNQNINFSNNTNSNIINNNNPNILNQGNNPNNSVQGKILNNDKAISNDDLFKDFFY